MQTIDRLGQFDEVITGVDKRSEEAGAGAPPEGDTDAAAAAAASAAATAGVASVAVAAAAAQQLIGRGEPAAAGALLEIDGVTLRIPSNNTQLVRLVPL